MNEFEIIKTYFAADKIQRQDVVVGIGDDAAVLHVPQDQELVVTTDTLIPDVHFPKETDPFDIGYKALAVNLSDLAAISATPAWISLSLTLPENDESWMRSFSSGLMTLKNHYHIQLVGGDLTKGPLSITIQAMGFVPRQQALLRSGAKTDDLIYVSGTLGDAGLALQYLQTKRSITDTHVAYLLSRLNRPEPRISLGKNLGGIANAAIDISDGLAADLGHILEESNKGAVIYVDQLPLSLAVTETLPSEEAIQLALTAGDDYELCFTVPQKHQSVLQQKMAAENCPISCIGHITASSGFVLVDKKGNEYHGATKGYKHF